MSMHSPTIEDLIIHFNKIDLSHFKEERFKHQSLLLSLHSCFTVAFKKLLCCDKSCKNPDEIFKQKIKDCAALIMDKYFVPFSEDIRYSEAYPEAAKEIHALCYFLNLLSEKDYIRKAYPSASETCNVFSSYVQTSDAIAVTKYHSFESTSQNYVFNMYEQEDEVLEHVRYIDETYSLANAPTIQALFIEKNKTCQFLEKIRECLILEDRFDQVSDEEDFEIYEDFQEVPGNKDSEIDESFHDVGTDKTVTLSSSVILDDASTSSSVLSAESSSNLNTSVMHSKGTCAPDSPILSRSATEGQDYTQGMSYVRQGRSRSS